MFFAGYLAAGGAAGATSLTVSYPLEYTYTRMAADVGGHYTGIIDCLTKTVKTDGVLGLYRGYGPSVAGIVVYRAGYFGLYDFSKTSLIPSLGLKGRRASYRYNLSTHTIYTTYQPTLSTLHCDTTS